MDQELAFPYLCLPPKEDVDSFRDFVRKNTHDVFLKQNGNIQPCLFCDDGEQLYMTIIPHHLVYFPKMACSLIESLSSRLPKKVLFKGYAVSAWKANKELIELVEMGVDIEQISEKLKAVATGKILPQEGSCNESLIIYLRMDNGPFSSFEIWKSNINRSELGITLSEWDVPNQEDALGSVFNEYFGELTR